MGMYTELMCDILLKPETPEAVITALEAMSSTATMSTDENCGVWLGLFGRMFPYSELFKQKNIHILNCNYVAIGTDDIEYYSDFSIPVFKLEKLPETDQYHLVNISNFKATNNIVGKFFNWLAPFIDYTNQKPVGYKLYEECTHRTYYVLDKDTNKISELDHTDYYDTKGLFGNIYIIKEVDQGEPYYTDIKLETANLDEAATLFSELKNKEVYQYFGGTVITLEVCRDYRSIYETSEKPISTQQLKDEINKNCPTG